MKPSNFRLGIGVPLAFHMVPSDFFETFAAMQKPPYVLLKPSRSGNFPADIAAMRNGLVLEAQATHCTHLIMLDTDQAYPPDTIPRLLSHKQMVVGAKIRRRYPPFDVLMFRGTIGAYRPAPWTRGELTAVDATGTGCILYDMRVFKTIPGPWFEVWTHDGKPVGEDFVFCSKLREAGIPIYVDTAVDVHHLSQMRITDSWAAVYERVMEAVQANT